MITCGGGSGTWKVWGLLDKEGNVSLWGDENILKLIVVMVTQL